MEVSTQRTPCQRLIDSLQMSVPLVILHIYDPCNWLWNEMKLKGKLKGKSSKLYENNISFGL